MALDDYVPFPDLGDAVEGAVEKALGIDRLTRWLEGTAVKALLYVTLTLLAVGLVIAGLGRMGGVTPASLLGARRGGGGGGEDEIPF